MSGISYIGAIEGLDEPLESPYDDLPQCNWVGHCDCYTELGEPCCNCDEVPDDYEEE